MSQGRTRRAAKQLRHPWRLLAGASLLVGIMAVVWLVLPDMTHQSSGVRLTRDSFSEISEGMTLSEVETVLGGSAGEYSTRPIGDPRGATRPPDGCYERTWVDNHAMIEITFNGEDRVVMKQYYKVSPLDNSWIAYLKSLMGQ
jgi:hypothetical protein